MPEIEFALTEGEAAKILHVSRSILKRRRMLMQPPEYFRVGRSVRYRPEALARFMRKPGSKWTAPVKTVSEK